VAEIPEVPTGEEPEGVDLKRARREIEPGSDIVVVG